LALGSFLETGDFLAFADTLFMLLNNVFRNTINNLVDIIKTTQNTSNVNQINTTTSDNTSSNLKDSDTCRILLLNGCRLVAVTLIV
jgi:hypothetical protein